ncbi:MAG TPA: hypothetical protein VMV01_07820 [Planctomycetota bacterium]|nr:hypothetical protein [Planctomycetota bacterium]
MLRMLILLATLLLAGLIWTGCACCAADDQASVSIAAGTPATVAGAQSDDEDEAADEVGDDDGEEADGEEQALSLDQVPANVLEAARAAVPGVVLVSAELERENGQFLYSLAGTVGDEPVEIEVSVDGTVLEIERGGE